MASPIEPAHAVAVLTQLFDMYKVGSGTDLVVAVGARRFEVHGCVIMCGSEFFRTLLQTDVGAGTVREATLPSMDAHVFELIVECIYTGVASIDATNVMELLEASKRMQVGVAEAQCCKWLLEHLDVSSALVVWDSTRQLGCEDVQAKAWAMVGRHLAEVARQDAFLALPLLLLVELMTHDSLAVPNEAIVYEAVMGWIRSDVDSRKGAIGVVLGTVRIELLPASFLLENVATDPLIVNSVDACRLVAKASPLMYMPSDVLADRHRDSLLRKRKMPNAGLMVIGGQDLAHNFTASVECFDPSIERWQALPDMNVPRDGCAAACIDGIVYVAGGFSGSSTLAEPLASAECFNPWTGVWKRLPDMSVPRGGCASACIGGLFYVVGGGEYSDSHGLSSLECYDPSTGVWQALPDMSLSDVSGSDRRLPRHQFAAASSEQLLYVVGGMCPEGDSDEHYGRTYLASVECYDPSTRLWHALPSMNAPRYNCAAACIDGRLYVVGGFGGDGNFVKNSECYDPSTGQWSVLPSMNFPRFSCAAACMDGLLYSVGGWDLKNDAGKGRSAERFDPLTADRPRQWRALPAMSTERIGCAAVALH